MIPRFRLVKLDCRYKMHRVFSHRIEFIGPIRESAQLYQKVYEDMVNLHGPGADVDVVKCIGKKPTWSFAFKTSDYPHIYLTDSSLTYFFLNKPKYENFSKEIYG
jgi:hypothetical protein